MTDPNIPASDRATAEFIDYEEFRNGLPHGRFHLIVNPDLARRFVSHRVNATPVAIALIGCGIAAALAGYPWIGLVMVGAGVLFRRAIKWQAAKLLLQITTRSSDAYFDATTHGVMEVRRR